MTFMFERNSIPGASFLLTGVLWPTANSIHKSSHWSSEQTTFDLYWKPLTSQLSQLTFTLSYRIDEPANIRSPVPFESID